MRKGEAGFSRFGPLSVGGGDQAMLSRRSAYVLMGALLTAIPAGAWAQGTSGQTGSAPGATSGATTHAAEPATSEVIDGVTYYYDADGNVLYYDDPVHYSPSRRVYSSNGGWVVGKSSGGHRNSRRAVRAFRSAASKTQDEAPDGKAHEADESPEAHEAENAGTPSAASPRAIKPARVSAARKGVNPSIHGARSKHAEGSGADEPAAKPTGRAAPKGKGHDKHAAGTTDGARPAPAGRKAAPAQSERAHRAAPSGARKAPGAKPAQHAAPKGKPGAAPKRGARGK